MSKSLTYKGVKFYIQSSGRYYSTRQPINGERLLHRLVWVEANGHIPDGFHVHHIDGKWENNNIENLELVKATDHQASHMVERWASGDTTNFLKGLDKAREAAKAWHASEEGRKWHSATSKTQWETRKPHSCVCKQCGSSFESYWPNKAKFCSKSCSQKFAYIKNRVVSTCKNCGKEFDHYRYRVQDCCSYKCSNDPRFRLKKT